MSRLGLAFAGALRQALVLALIADYARSQTRARRKHTVVQHEILVRPRNERHELGDEVQRLVHHMRGAIGPGRLELQLHAPVWQYTEPVVGQRRARAVPHELLELPLTSSLFGRDRQPSMQVEAVEMRLERAQLSRWAKRVLPRRGELGALSNGSASGSLLCDCRSHDLL